jgi:prepilin signal peptidase PulO-like enzyme (type II secretory pathway)
MKGGVGGGDVKLAACGGFYLGFADSFGVLFFSLISMLIASVIFIRIKKLPRKTSLPYAPFYEAACILLCLARFFA